MTARTQTAPDAPQGDDATATPSPPSGTPKAPRKGKPASGKARPRGKSATPAKPAKAAHRRIGPAAREEAYRMIAEGIPMRAVARELRVNHETVTAWRDSSEGKERLDALRAKRDQELGAIQRKARLQLEALIPRAVQRLGDALESANLNVVVRASAQILDRAGMPRTERVEAVGDGEIDLSELTAEELDQLRALHEKASRRGPLA